LKFVLDEQRLCLSLPMIPSANDALEHYGAAASAVTPALSRESGSVRSESAGACSACGRLAERLHRFQQRQLARCRAYVIPCAASDVVGAGAGGELAIARPVLQWRCLLPLRKLADAHPKLYCSFLLFCIGVPSIAVSYFLDNGPVKGSVALSLNPVLVIFIFALMSSARYGIDAAAAKHVAASFRFLTFAVLLCMWVLLDARSAYIGNMHPTQAAAEAVTALLFLLTLLFDCSPRLPAAVQVAVSVIARRMRLTQRLTVHSAQQAGFCIILGVWAFKSYQHVLVGNARCFMNIGAYQLCLTTQKLSIYSSLFLLMAQASVWRMLVPGMSNFVNASVRPSACARVCCAALALRVVAVLHWHCAHVACRRFTMCNERFSDTVVCRF
jgi:hypothetical protein